MTILMDKLFSMPYKKHNRKCYLLKVVAFRDSTPKVLTLLYNKHRDPLTN